MSARLQFLCSIHPDAKRLGARIPDRKHLTDSGYDVYPVDLSEVDSKWPKFPVTLEPGQALAIPTGLTFVAPEGWSPDVVAKTGRALQGIVPAAIVFDWGYRPDKEAIEGSVFSIRNVSDKPVVIYGDKAFAQLVLRPVCPADAVEVEHGKIDTATDRGQKRYGVADGEAAPFSDSEG